MKHKIITVVEGVFMGLEHRGLSALIKKEAKIDLRTIDSDHLVLCVNGRGTAAKLMGAGGTVLAYFRPGDKKQLSAANVESFCNLFGAPALTLSPSVKRILHRIFSEGAQLKVAA